VEHWLAVATGGAAGASARYATYLIAAHLGLTGFPWATLTVNVLGSLAMGALVSVTAVAWSPSPALRAFLVVGVLGAYTTFSTFALDVGALWERGRPLALALYVAGSLLLSVGAFFTGMLALRRLLP